MTKNKQNNLKPIKECSNCKIKYFHDYHFCMYCGRSLQDID